MATISALRETLRIEVGDLIRLSKDVTKRFQNEQLDAALYDALRQHNRSYTWATLPPEEEQLIRILAKSHMARDKSLEYALDPKMQAGGAYTRDKVPNADMLLRISQALYQEYIQTRDMLASGPEGDVIVSDLIRTSRSTRARVPMQAATAPAKPVLYSATYEYNADTKLGYVHIKWNRNYDHDLAFLRVYLSQNPFVTTSDEVIRTFYDLVSLYQAAPFTINSVSLTNPQMAQQEAIIEKTIVPTGKWYIMMLAVNWNGLFSASDPIALEVQNYRKLSCDAFVVGA